MGAEKSRSPDATINVTFESASRAFNADNPIVGMIHINANKTIPAFCIQATLQ